MAKMTPDQWNRYADQWKRAAPELDRVRREELGRMKYDGQIVDALLDIGAKAPFKEEEPNGLVEMQKWFMKAARKQGLLPSVVREQRASYGGSDQVDNALPKSRKRRTARGRGKE